MVDEDLCFAETFALFIDAHDSKKTDDHCDGLEARLNPC